MISISTLQQLEQLKASPAFFILFGGAHCGVCQAIKPGIEKLLAQHFPDIALVYIDCEQYPDICAQNNVFSLPVTKLYIEGQLTLEMARSFSLKELAAQLERIYRLWKET
jgi:thioredoxin-like negative regulator of GroEL